MSRSPFKTDRPANLAVLAGVASIIALTVEIIALVVPTGYAGRSNPIYWILMAPCAVWAWSAIDFRSWALRLLPVILVGVPLVAGALLLAAPGLGHADVVTLWIVLVLGVCCGGLGWRWRSKSGLVG